MRSLGASERGSAHPPPVRHLVLNQTIGVLAVVGLAASLLRSERVRALASRTSLGAHVSEWLTSKASATRPADVMFVAAMIALMIAWTVGCQRAFARGAAISRAEWRPAGARRIPVALYLLVSASVVEEIVYRGLALPAAVFYLGPARGLAASATLFGLLHFEKGRLGQLVVTGYGAILGAGLLLGSSLLACVLAHAGGNAIAFFLPQSPPAARRSPGHG